jgi:hypothetical protein
MISVTPMPAFAFIRAIALKAAITGRSCPFRRLLRDDDDVASRLHPSVGYSPGHERLSAVPL